MMVQFNFSMFFRLFFLVLLAGLVVYCTGPKNQEKTMNKADNLTVTEGVDYTSHKHEKDVSSENKERCKNNFTNLGSNSVG